MRISSPELDLESDADTIANARPFKVAWNVENQQARRQIAAGHGEDARAAYSDFKRIRKARGQTVIAASPDVDGNRGMRSGGGATSHP